MGRGACRDAARDARPRRQAARARGAVSDYGDANAFIMKLNGAAVRDEDTSVADAGARDGSIFLLTFRRRRPVRS